MAEETAPRIRYFNPASLDFNLVVSGANLSFFRYAAKTYKLMVVNSKATYKVMSSPAEARNIIPTMDNKSKAKYSP